MNKEFIPYEQALELKELGFDEPCLFAFDNCSTPIRCTDLRTSEQKFNGVNYNSSTYTSQPTFSQAFRWFRENYGYNCFITSSTIDGKWYYFRENLNNRKDDSEPELTPKFDTYEEAELACLKTLIELIKK